MDRKNIYGWLDGYITIDGQFDASKKIDGQIEDTKIDGWIYNNRWMVE